MEKKLPGLVIQSRPGLYGTEAKASGNRRCALDALPANSLYAEFAGNSVFLACEYSGVFYAAEIEYYGCCMTVRMWEVHRRQKVPVTT